MDSGVMVLCSETGLVDFVEDLELYELIEFFRFREIMKKEETFLGEDGGVVTCWGGFGAGLAVDL